MEYYYIIKNKKTEIDSKLDIFNMPFKSISELKLPDTIKVLKCKINNLTQLEVPSNCEILDCSQNKISEIELPESCKTIDLSQNKIKTLLLPKNADRIKCSSNNIEKLIIPQNCKYLDCRKNKIKELSIPDNVIDIHCSTNKLTKLETSKACLFLDCSKNNIEELIIHSNQITHINCSDNNIKQLVVPDSCGRLNCTGNKIVEISVPKNCKVTADPIVNINYRSISFNKFNKVDPVISDLILKIKNPVLWSIADQLTKSNLSLELTAKIDIKEIKKLANSNPTLSQMLSKKEGQALLKANSSGFSIQDIQAADFFNGKALCNNKNIEIAHSNWAGGQRYFKDKPNYVIQFNLKPFKLKEILKYGFNNEHLEAYIQNSNHPTSNSTLTLAWVRYTYLEERNAIVIDEIQTDMDDEDYLGDLMQGRDEFTLKLFIQYVRKQYKIRKIYMPTYTSKLNLYDASPPMYLYKELPNKFGFKKTSDLEGFMVLEKFELPNYEDYSLL